VVIDCAFLTRDRVATMPLADYFTINESLIANTLAAAHLDSVRRVVTISSGAAVFPVDALSRPREENPYGWLKRHAEHELESVAQERGISAVIARAWSLSGAFVRHPAHYALFDMITQAIAGAIHITATAPVYRRYTSVEDLLAVALSNAGSPGATVIDSAGPLLEMAELAAAVARVVNTGAPITRAQPDGGAPHAYFAEPASWDRACVSAAFVPADIDEQIAIAYQGLLDPRGNNPT
jgi:nucleoside-diphosphate-sugar epimerase